VSALSTAPEALASELVCAVLRIGGAARSFGDVRALDGVDVELQPGEILTLLGPSGCGKTTLLRAIAGLEPLDRGSIQLRGRDVTRRAPSERGTAMVFQDGGLFPHLRVAPNIALGAGGGRRLRQQRDANVRRVAEMLRIGDLLERRPHELSGGQRQRVGIARALVGSPSLLLMDEPFASLDADLRLELRRELRRLHQEHELVETVFVTHDQTEALGIADRIAVMFSGRIAQIGTPTELLERPVSITVARFLGVPRINLVEHGSTVLGVRPSDLTVSSSEHRSLRVKGVVRAREPFAGGWLVTLVCKGLEIEGALRWDVECAPGTALTLACAPHQPHLFERASGLRTGADAAMVTSVWNQAFGGDR
jgi:ABC-type sugar transport system ATPase subunit